MEAHPYLNPKLPIQWSKMTHLNAEADFELALADAKANIEKLRNLTDDEISFDTVFGALDRYVIKLDLFWDRLSNLKSVRNSPEIAEVAKKLYPIKVEFESQTFADDKLWRVAKRAQEKLKDEDLTGEQRRVMDLFLLEFKNNGADLPEDKKKRVGEISMQIAKYNLDFTQNYLNSSKEYEYYITDPKDLEGIPESSIQEAKESAEEKGHPGEWRFNLDYCSKMAILKYAKNEEIRKKIWEASNSVACSGKYDNTNNIFEILKLRNEKAKILGYKSFADYVLSDRMAKNGDTAMKFINDFHDKVEKQFNEECQSLIQYKSEKLGCETKEVYPWERAYYAEMRRKELFDFDEESLKPYFNSDSVLDGMFKIASELFGINIVEKKTFCPKEGETVPEDCTEVWDKYVKFYDVFDNNTKKHIASFYTDWYSRDNKNSGGWTHPLINEDKENPISLGIIAGNFQKPTSGKPALLTHSSVETIFHEFGHLCHHILSETNYRVTEGTNVSWDFVEFPSQLLENWTWERDALNIFAKHYETGENIPEELFQKMMKARNYNSATFFMGQLSYGKIDMEIHHNYEKFCNKTIEEINEEVLKGYVFPCSIKQRSILYVFGHLFSDTIAYAAGYYSYKWAEVIDADAFTRFAKEGILNSKTGMDYRDKVLSKGNSIPPEQIFRNFMGRDPDQTALLIRSGIHD